uniref:Uncharacterized protein n=1 Tax=Arundo donax TaxID=35708 RepID=A0A0A9CVH9_ARUDO
MASSFGARLFSSTLTDRFRCLNSHDTLLYSTSTVRSLVSSAAMPGRAMAANAGLLSTRSVRFVLARSVTTTRAPAATHSFLSLHRTWKQAPQPTPPRYSVGLAATRKPPLKDAAAVPYPQEPPVRVSEEV